MLKGEKLLFFVQNDRILNVKMDFIFHDVNVSDLVNICLCTQDQKGLLVPTLPQSIGH